MESPLVPFILHKIGSMRRHYQASDEHDGAQNRGHEQQQQRRPQEPDDGSRGRPADPPAVASPTSIAPTMHAAKKRRTSDTSSSGRSFSYQKSKSFEERNEERSAFTSLPKTKDDDKAKTASTQEEEEKKPRLRSDPLETGAPIVSRPVASMSSTITTASSSHAQPHLSPMRYYHQQRYAENIGSKPDAPAFHYPYGGGAAYPTPQHYPYGYPAGYYNAPQYPRPDPPSARGHPQFPYFQGYNYQPPPPLQQQQHTQYPNQMMPSAAAYPLPPRQFFDESWATPAGVSHSKKDPPESIKVTQVTKAGGGGAVNLSLTVSSPPIEEDERKPSATSSSSIQESSSRDHLKKPTSPPHAELHDLYAPMAFNDVGSLLTSPMKTPSPPSPSTQFAASEAAHLDWDAFTNSPERNPDRSVQLPHHSPVVSSSKKRTRGRHPEHHPPVRQSHSSTSATASDTRHGNSWDRRFSELVSLHFMMLNVCLPS